MSTIVVSTTSYLQHWEEEPLNLVKSQVDLSQKEDLGKCLINVYLYTRGSNRGIAKILLKTYCKKVFQLVICLAAALKNARKKPFIRQNIPISIFHNSAEKNV